jgi:hypothetical protein
MASHRIRAGDFKENKMSYTCSEKCPYDTHCDGINCQQPDMKIHIVSPNTPEPQPVKNNLPAVWDLVMADIQECDAIGEKKYGVRLQPFNGRDVLKDAYQEALDLVVYLRQAIYERDNNPEVQEDGGFW